MGLEFSIPILSPSSARGAIRQNIQMPEMDGFQATRNIRQAELVTNRHTICFGNRLTRISFLLIIGYNVLLNLNRIFA